jgi:outer membrane protein assembly factor BamB
VTGPGEPNAGHAASPLLLDPAASLAWSAGDVLELRGRLPTAAELTFSTSAPDVTVMLDGAPQEVERTPAGDGWSAVGLDVPAGQHTVAISAASDIELRAFALGGATLDPALIAAAARASRGHPLDIPVAGALDYFTSFEETGLYYFLSYIDWIDTTVLALAAPEQSQTRALSGTYCALFYENLLYTSYIATEELDIPANSASVTIGGWFYIGSATVTIDAKIKVDGNAHGTTWAFTSADVGAWVYRRFTLSLNAVNKKIAGEIQLNSASGSGNEFLLDDFGVDFAPSTPPELQEVVFGDIGGKLYGVDATTGSQRWAYASSGMVTAPPAIGGGIAYLATSGTPSKLTAIECRRGQAVWSVPLPAGMRAGPVLYGGAVILGMDDGEIRAFNTTNGSEAWSRQFMPVAPSSRVTVNGAWLSDSLMVLTTDQGIVCFDVATQMPRWRVLTDMTFSYPAEIAAGMVYAGTNSGTLYALSLETGATTWTYPTGGPIYSQPQYVGGAVIFGSDDGHLYMLNAGNGSVLRTLPFAGQQIRSFLCEGGYLYVVGNAVDGAVTAYELKIGQQDWPQLWRAPLTNGAQADPVVQGDRVYITGSDAKIHALRQSDGSTAWTFQPGRMVLAGGAIAVPSPAMDTSRRFDQCCWLGTHNAYASTADGWWYAQQRKNIPDQLDGGVRMLMVDIWTCTNEIVYAHEGCDKNWLMWPFTSWKRWQDSLAEIRDWLVRNPSEIVTMILEQRVGNQTAIQNVITASGIRDQIFWADRANSGPNGTWNVGTQGWPSLAWMIAANKRFVILSDQGKGSSYSGADGLPYVWRWAVENNYGDDSRNGQCNARAFSKPLDQNPPGLFILNYNTTLSYNPHPDGEDQYTRFAVLNDSANIMGIVDGCMGLRGNRLPNFVAVDYFDYGRNGGPPQAVDEINQRWALRAQQEQEA